MRRWTERYGRTRETQAEGGRLLSRPVFWFLSRLTRIPFEQMAKETAIGVDPALKQATPQEDRHNAETQAQRPPQP